MVRTRESLIWLQTQSQIRFKNIVRFVIKIEYYDDILSNGALSLTLTQYYELSVINMFTHETCPGTHVILAGILVLAGGANPPAPVVLTSTEMCPGTQFTRAQDMGLGVGSHGTAPLSVHGG